MNVLLPISRSQLAAIVNDGIPGDSVRDIRDTALILVSFWACLRASEVALLDRGHVVLTEIPSAGGRQLLAEVRPRPGAEPVKVYPEDSDDTCPTTFLDWWIELRARFPGVAPNAGPLFLSLGGEPRRMSTESITRMFRQRAGAAGFDLQRVRFHGLRLGGARERSR